MANQVQIKCYLFPQDAKITKKAAEKASEIRRFNVENVDGVYNNLLEKIMTYFKNTFENKSEVKTFYLDDEEEFIGFSSDSEFQYGIDVQLAARISNNAVANVFKIYVAKCKVSTAEASTTDEEEQSDNKKTCCDEKRGKKCDGMQRDAWRQKREMFQSMKSMMRSINDPEHLKQFGEYLKGVFDQFGIDFDFTENEVKEKDNENYKETQNDDWCHKKRWSHHKHHGRHPHHHGFDNNIEQSDIHFGVFCDGCKQQVAGDRFKCTGCPNYDLCSTCMSNGVHKESNHVLVKTELTEMSRRKCGRYQNHPFKDMFRKMKQSMRVINDQEQLKTFAEHLKTSLEAFGVNAECKVDDGSNTNGEQLAKEEEKPILNVSIINNDTASSVQSITTPLIPLTPANNSLQSVDTENDKIRKVVLQLQEMGFDDNNNWLTALVVSKDGNLNAVLDSFSAFSSLKN